MTVLVFFFVILEFRLACTIGGTFVASDTDAVLDRTSTGFTW